MLVGRLISVGDDSLEDIDEIEFARSEDEDEQQSWSRRTGRMGVYEELAGLDYFSSRSTKTAPTSGLVGEDEDTMPISELIKVRSQQAKRPALADWETSTQTPSVLTVGRPHQAARYFQPAYKAWEGRPVYVPPGCQLKDLLPGGTGIIGPAQRPNPFKDQFDEMLRVLNPKGT